MSDRYLEILRDVGHSGNNIPSGRQLLRTPPLTDVKRHLDFCDEDQEEPQQSMEATRHQDNSDQNSTFDFSTPETKTEPISKPDDPNSMLKGMKGYQLTQSDLEFIEKMKEEKLVKKLQGDLEEVQRLLKKEMMAAELACASREKARAQLKRFPSCEELTDWATVVLKMTSPSTELTDLDTKSLLALVTKEAIQRAVDEKRVVLARMEEMVVNKRNSEAEERGRLEKQIASEQLRIQGLMSQLSDLKSELAQQEETYKALEMQMNSREAPEIQVEAEETDTSEELQVSKGQVKRRGKERKKAVKSENSQDSANQSKSKRSKHTDGKTDDQASGKDDHANKNASETLKTKQKSGAAAERLTKPVKAARRPQKKAEEKESNPQESELAVRGRRKPRGTSQTAASQPKNQSEAQTGEAQSTSQQAAASRSRQKAAGAAGESQSAGLRRSKRIASRS